MVQTCLKKTDLRSKLCSYLETTENVGPGGIPIDRVFELSWLFIVKVGESVPIKISHLDF